MLCKHTGDSETSPSRPSLGNRHPLLPPTPTDPSQATFNTFIALIFKQYVPSQFHIKKLATDKAALLEKRGFFAGKNKIGRVKTFLILILCLDPRKSPFLGNDFFNPYFIRDGWVQKGGNF